MLCPTDGRELLLAERHGVEIDYCPACRGVWLDRGELDKILDHAAVVAEDRASASRTSTPVGATPAWGSPGDPVRDREEERRREERDRRAERDRREEERRDREERARRDEHRRREGRDRDRDDRDRHKRKRRDSWLEDLFDFD